MRAAQLFTIPLLLLSACADAPVVAPASDPEWFRDVTHELGVDFTIDRAAAGDYFMPDIMGAGLALFDFDGDDDLDLYLVNGFRAADGRKVTAEGANRLYRQSDDGRFVDVTTTARVGHEGYGMGAAVGDYDNDGDLDLYVSNDGPDALYRNDGNGVFTDVTVGAGVANVAWSASCGFVDYDGDGWLDIFVTNYLDYDETLHPVDAAGRPRYPAPDMFEGVPDVLLRNNGDGTFADVSVEAGLDAPGKGLGVVFLDLNDDDRIDIYVANDGEVNFAWINDGDGHFTDAAAALGLAANINAQPEASMGIACGDVDDDGEFDLLLTHLLTQTNTLYRREPSGGFTDVTRMSGLGAPSLNETGFGVGFGDVDLDGDLDAVVANGRVLRRPPVHASSLSPHWAPYGEYNRLYLNDGGGRFEKGSGLPPDVEVSRGLLLADIDGDGDLDVIVTNGNGTTRVYRNVRPRTGNWLGVRAVDPGLARDAYGAIVTVTVAGRRLVRDISPTRSYLSSGEVRAHFGIGAASAVEAIAVRWPDGTSETFPGVAANTNVRLERGSGIETGNGT